MNRKMPASSHQPASDSAGGRPLATQPTHGVLIASDDGRCRLPRPHMWYYYSGDNYGRKEPQLVSFYVRDECEGPYYMYTYRYMYIT